MMILLTRVELVIEYIDRIVLVTETLLMLEVGGETVGGFYYRFAYVHPAKKNTQL